MLHKQIDLRWWLLNNLVRFDHLQELYKLFVIISFVAFLFLSLSPILLAKVSKNNLKRLLLSDMTFTLSLFAFILAARWPGFLASALNADEALFISGAMKLLKDPVFWRSLQTGSSGPLNIYPLTVPALFGLRLEYATSRLIGLFLITTPVICLYYSLRYLYGNAIARLSAIPVVTCIALMTFYNYIHYSGEHVSIAILSIALLMLCRYYSKGLNSNNGLIFSFGFTIGLIPYAKLQAVPVAFLLSCIFLHITWVKNKTRHRFLRSLFIFLAGAMLFSGLVMLYLAIFSLQDVFWGTYIQGNLFYLNLNSSKSFFEKFLTYLPYITQIADTNVLFLLTGITLIFGLPFLIGRRNYTLLSKVQPDTFIFVYYSLAFLIASGYSAVEPGRGSSHHLLFLLIPSGFLIGVFLGEFWKVLQIQESIIRRSLKFSLVIVIVTAIFFRIREGNPYIAHSRFLATNYLSLVVKAILKHASAGDSLAVWGCAPELYVDTGLVQATKVGNLYYEIEPNPRQQYLLKQFADDFLNSGANIFVDAVAPGMFYFKNRETQGYEAFPEVASIVKKYYTFVDEVQGVRIYVRR